MTWTAVSPGFPAAFSLLAREGGAATSPGQRGRAAPLLLLGPRGGRCAGREGLRRPLGTGDSPVPRERERPGAGRQVLPVRPAEDARGRSAAEPGAERPGPGKAPAPAAGAARLLRPPEAQPGGQVLQCDAFSPSFRDGSAEGAHLCAAVPGQGSGAAAAAPRVGAARDPRKPALSSGAAHPRALRSSEASGALK